MPEIILTTLNAKFIHTAFGLRCLLANLGCLQDRTQLLEFDINQRPLEIADALLAYQPKIICLGVYIWNTVPATELVAILKRVRPEVIVVLGGPEVSFETESQPIVELADYVITGEGDVAVGELCAQLLAGQRPRQKIMPAEPPELSRLASPYDAYNDRDISHRLIYVEASRGCPFACEFCLSGGDAPVRFFPLPALLDQFQKLLNRGVRHFKFVDRSFNLNLPTALAILDFFQARYQPGLFLHFEMMPDRFPDSLRKRLVRYPAGSLQLEIGIQTFNPEVAERIQRRQDFAAIDENLRFLRIHTSAHLHTDLIAGLPGESLESFAQGFDRLVALNPQEIQVGILKRLRGAAIAHHDDEWKMIYHPQPPYEILQNRLLAFAAVQRLRRFARFWDLTANSGHFVETTPLIWREDRSPFAAFLRWTDWIFAQAGGQHGIALTRLTELLFRYLTEKLGQAPAQVAPVLWSDYQRTGHSDKPPFLRDYLGADTHPGTKPTRSGLLKRQARRQG